MEEILHVVRDVPVSIWMTAIIGGIVFASIFNIPARRKFLSRQSDSRELAIRYDALNFIVFYFTFILSTGIIWALDRGDLSPLIVLTIAFVIYSLSFWVVLRLYIRVKDNE